MASNDIGAANMTNGFSAVNAANTSNDSETTPSYTADKVFHTVELLDTILLNLDFKSLLFSQAVNKTFAATIASSIKLQRALHFQPPAKLRDNPSASPPSAPRPFVIKTSERYKFEVKEMFEGDVAFNFETAYPTPRKPATGSWRRMHVRVVDDLWPCRFLLTGPFGYNQVLLRRTKEECTLGEALDTLLTNFRR